MASPSRESNTSQIKNEGKNNIAAIKEGKESDTIALARTKLEVPNIDVKPQKSILKNANLAKNEARAAIINDYVEGNFVLIYFINDIQSLS